MRRIVLALLVAMQPITDWVLKGAEVPYDNVNELTVEYQLGSLPSDFLNIRNRCGSHD